MNQPGAIKSHRDGYTGSRLEVLTLRWPGCLGHHKSRQHGGLSQAYDVLTNVCQIITISLYQTMKVGHDHH